MTVCEWMFIIGIEPSRLSLKKLDKNHWFELLTQNSVRKQYKDKNLMLRQRGIKQMYKLDKIDVLQTYPTNLEPISIDKLGLSEGV